MTFRPLDFPRFYIELSDNRWEASYTDSEGNTTRVRAQSPPEASNALERATGYRYGEHDTLVLYANGDSKLVDKNNTF